jgi:SAM-dependent methyltransferase
MLRMFTGGTPKSREEYWRVRTQAFNTPHRRLCAIRDLILTFPKPPATLLDVGCGRGTLKSLLPSSIEYFGLDLTAAALEGGLDARHFQVVDLDRSPEAFGREQFDTVVCSGAMEYIAHTHRFLSFLREKVSPAGHLILSFTNRQHYRDLWGWVTGRRRQYKDPHVNFMLIPQLVSELRAHGFVILGHDTLTLSHRPLPLLGRFWRFPLNVFARQYIFVCANPERERSARDRATHRARTRDDGGAMRIPTEVSRGRGEPPTAHSPTR